MANPSAEVISTNCEHCGGGMTYPPEHEGMTSQCPHCQKEIVLGRTAPVVQSKTKQESKQTFWTLKGGKEVIRVAPVRLCDRFAARRLGSATTKRSGDSNEIEPVILVGY